MAVVQLKSIELSRGSTETDVEAEGSGEAVKTSDPAEHPIALQAWAVNA